MRVLCSFAGGAGHLVPQLPLHRALAEAGHTLTLSGRASAVASAPPGWYEHVAARPDRRTTDAASIAPLAPIDREHELAVVARHFAGTAADESAAAVAPLLPGADLVVCDELDLGALGAAQRAGVPTVSVAVVVSGALVRPGRLGDALRELGRRVGTSGPVRPRGDRVVVPFHPAMRDPAFPAPDDALWMRPDPGPAAHPGRGTFATLGTEFNTESGDLFERILRALAGADVPATVAVGRDLDPARFGPQPGHVLVVRHVDVDEVVAGADVVIHHGGSGMFLRSVLGGAAQLVLPMGADQPFTADQVERLGVGRVLDPTTATPDAIGRAVAALRADHSTRQRVSRLRDATLTLPDPRAVADRVTAGR